MAKRTKLVTEPGSKLPCPWCGESDATIKLALDSFTCECESCGEQFAAEVARNKIAEGLRRWDAVLSFLALGSEILNTVPTVSDLADELDQADVA